MRRREFIGLIGSVAATWPLAARAQKTTTPLIGWLASGTSNGYAAFAAAFRQGLSETGYVEGQNVAIEYRWAEGQYEQLPALAADLVRRQVAVIAAAGTSSAIAAKAATATIPVVFSTAFNPVEVGLVASLHHPGGNVTGVSNFAAVLVAKQFELLHELIPNSSVFGVLLNPTDPDISPYVTRDVQTAARTLKREIHILNASTEGQIDAAYSTFAQLRAGAVIIGADTFFVSRRDQLIALAARHAIPTVYFLREFVTAGGLMSYGSNQADFYRLFGVYVGRILKGEKPSDLPVQQPTKVELFINLKTAKALGLTFPITLLGRADEVIE
jgi:putative tryptophan/tyrosine transport system substrate-binding protein